MAEGTPGLTPVARRIRKRLLALDGVLESPGIFEEGDALWVNGKEVGYFTEDGELLGLRLTKGEISARRSVLKNDLRVMLKPSSNWLHVRISKQSDVAFALELASIAVDAHRCADGTAPALPPVGAKLARMRRFH